MSLKIAIPDSQLYNGIFLDAENLKKIPGINVLRFNEQKCFESLINNNVQIAFLTPLGYGQGLAKADFKIIPGTALGAISYTSIATISFYKNTKVFKTLSCSNKNDFISVLAKILLAERYSLHLELIESKGTIREQLENFNSTLLFGKVDNDYSSLDLTEDWYDTYEILLPISFWVCNGEELPENIHDILNLLSVNKHSEIEISDADSTVSHQRQGKIIYQWSNEMEQALEQTLQLLYFHQFLPEIPAVKLYGRD